MPDDMVDSAPDPSPPGRTPQAAPARAPRLARRAPSVSLPLLILALAVLGGVGGGGLWWALERHYEAVLAGKDAEIHRLGAEVRTLTAGRAGAERQVLALRKQLLDEQAGSSGERGVNSDGLYQLGQEVAQSTSAHVDRANSLVAFDTIEADPDFNLAGEITYRDYLLGNCRRYGADSSERVLGQVVAREITHVTCQIADVR